MADYQNDDNDDDAAARRIGKECAAIQMAAHEKDVPLAFGCIWRRLEGALGRPPSADDVEVFDEEFALEIAWKVAELLEDAAAAAVAASAAASAAWRAAYDATERPSGPR